LVTPQLLLDGELEALVAQCGDLPNESGIEVEYADSCPTKIVPNLSAPRPSLIDCMANALSSVRSGCAIGLDCASVERSTLR
jgi:hypothetical protein